MIWRGFFNSFFYSIAFAAISVFVTILAAYPMSKKEFAPDVTRTDAEATAVELDEVDESATVEQENEK